MHRPIHQSRHRSTRLHWLLMLVLLWQGVAAASMAPQMRMTMPPAQASVAAVPPCHMTGMAEAAAPQPVHGVLESCCDHTDCAVAGLCAACILPMHAGVPPLLPLMAVPLSEPVADDVTAAASHPFRPPIL